MSCPICSSKMRNCFQAKVLAKYEAQYEVCDACGYLHAHAPDWLDEAYSRAIANADTGLLMRNITLANKISRIIYWLTPEHGSGRYLDVAGGYGILTRIMRDNGFDFYWIDRYCENLVAAGFEHRPELAPYSAVTAIEVLEHVVDPKAFIKESFDCSGADTLIFTTELYVGQPPKPEDWWYYAFSTGQHIGFFQNRTLQKIADDFGMYFATANGIHIISKNNINNLLFNLITNDRFSIFMPFLIRKKLGSKVNSDHQMIVNKLVKCDSSIK